MQEIIDTAGQEEYKTLRDIYFKDSDGFVLVYSITNAVSFSHAQRLKDRLTQIHGPGKPIILAGNKLDMEQDREVSEEEGTSSFVCACVMVFGLTIFAAYQYAVGQQVGFFECSAKEMLNVAELFSGAVRLIDRYRKANGVEQASKDAENAGVCACVCLCDVGVDSCAQLTLALLRATAVAAKRIGGACRSCA